MKRRELLQLCASIVGGLGIPGMFDATSNANSTTKNTLDASYLATGLVGMAQAQGWFDAHWGASVLAGYYLCRENRLGEETVAAIKTQLDAMIRLRPLQFGPIPEMVADEQLIERVPAALAPAVDGGLRAHGHGVIFACLSTKALRDAPQLAQPKLINGLCRLSTQIARIKPAKPEGEARYADTQAMIDATLDSLVRFKGLLGYPAIRRPNFTHIITHTEALISLNSMGYRDLVKVGQVGHREHISAPVPEFDPAAQAKADSQATLAEVMSPKYWENEENVKHWNGKWSESDNPNGTWVAFGHLFKVLYSYHRLIGHVEDKDKVRLCSQILLERYFNPEVQGG